ncbi:MAG: response regulator [Burkholderiales bacterium]|jgi:CheY-like chemotaxis protein|nr:response regulator [Burkholderiales bacterium]
MAETSSGATTAAEEDPSTILIVEDEILIRLTVADYLRECGFHVLEASNADEAVRVLEAEVEVDIVFSDIQMPGSMDGFALAQWIRQHHPRVRVLLTSGLGRTTAAARDLCDENPLMPKPYDHGSLLERLKNMLGR